MYEFVKTRTGWRFYWGPAPARETTMLPFPPTPAARQARLGLIRRAVRAEDQGPLAVPAASARTQLHLAC
jgi:hypothetical protein